MNLPVPSPAFSPNAATDIIIVKAEALPPSKVKIAVALPPKDKWNGVFLGNGNGGMGQNLSMKIPIIGANAGYASTHCDLGTDNWWKDPDNLDVVLADNWAEKGIAPESIKATVNVNGQKYTEEAELFVPEEDEEE